MSRTTITAILAAIAVPAALLASAGMASASPRPYPAPSVHALTRITGRPDGGNGSPDPYWADDNLTRGITITLTGHTGTGTATVYDFTATLTDEGTFTTIKGAQAPNQGPGYAGDLIRSAVTGPVEGYADFSFTATALPSAAPNAGVPAYENDHGAVPADSTSTWYELAFPAGTVFTGGIGDWSWRYDATVKTVTFRTFWTWAIEHHHWILVKETFPVVRVTHQQWTDASSNADGDAAGDGQITG